jgi:hypothetical protein
MEPEIIKQYTFYVDTYPGICLGSRIYDNGEFKAIAFYIPFISFVITRELIEVEDE